MALLDVVLYLVPDAKCTIAPWVNFSQVHDGVSTYLKVGQQVIIWNSANTSPCPTLLQLANADATAVNAARIARLKSIRNALVTSNFNSELGLTPGIGLKAVYMLAQKLAVGTPITSATLSDFLDQSNPIT